jgi:YidC/Oxa1 family membrane protein insertase
MPGWELLVDALRQLLFALAHHMDGSLGAGIAVIAAVARLLLMPLTVRAALAARDHQARVLLLKPQLDALKTRYADKPGELAAQTAALYKQHQISALPKGTLLTALVQIPLGAALYQAVRTGLTAGSRFLWLADLTKPDVALTALVGILAALGVGITGAMQPPGASPAGISTYTMAVVSGLLTVFFAFKLASGIGIYWAASSAVGILQPIIVRRIVLRRGA